MQVVGSGKLSVNGVRGGNKMGDRVSGLVKVGAGTTSIVIVIRGDPDPKCLETFKLELQKLALDCGLTVKNFKTGKKVKKNVKKK